MSENVSAGEVEQQSAPQPKTRRRRPLSRGRKLLFSAIAFCLVLLAGELLIRTAVFVRGWTQNCYAAHLDLFEPHPLNGYDLTPNFRLVSGVFRVRVNSLGLRGPEISVEKPNGVQRIAIVGGSSVYGFLVSDGEEAARVLETKLNADGESRYQVLNGGVPGYDLFQTNVRFQERIRELQPDVLITYLGFNDIRYLTSDRPEEFSVPRPLPYSWWERWARHSTLFTFVRYRLLGVPSHFVVGRVTTGLPTDAGIRQFQENMNELIASAREAGVEVMICAQATACHPDHDAELAASLGDDPAGVERSIEIFRVIHRELQNVAEEHSVPFIDAYNAIPATHEYLGDSIHLTQAGEARLAGLLEESLRSMWKKQESALVQEIDATE